MRLKSALARPAPQTLALAGLWAGLLDAALAACLLFIAVDRWAPPQDLPWKPLLLADPVGLATGAKFAAAARDPARCRAVLREGGVAFTEVPDRREGYCATENAVRLDGGVVALSPAAPVMTCPLALGYAFWSRHVVEPAARAELGTGVTRVEHYGTYACRTVYGRPGARPSEHARANALDAYGFLLADGRRATVAGQFRAQDSRGRFLRRIRDGACGWFHAVLSPDYNTAHRDHLHLDFGRYRACR